MNATLKSFAGTLSQVATTVGPMLGPKGALVAAAVSMATATVPQQARADLASDLNNFVQVQQVQPAQRGQQGQQAQQERSNIGRNVGTVGGGVAGYTLGRIVSDSSAVRALMAVGGAIAGGMAGKAWDERGQQQADVSGLNHVDRVLAGAVHTGNGKPMPQEIGVRLSAMMADAAARRVIVQHRLTAYENAELKLAANPSSAYWREAKEQSNRALVVAMNEYRQPFQAVRNAVDVARRQGYDIDAYAKAVNELARKVDNQSLMQFQSQEVQARVEAMGSQATNRLTLGDIEDDAVMLRAQTTVSTPRQR